MYDAVWLYARVLDSLIRKDKSLVQVNGEKSKIVSNFFFQDLHSDDTMEEFVAEMKKQDFIGVSGRLGQP